MASPIIRSIHIEKFRAFRGKDIAFTNNVVAIAGQNGTMKTTLMGMLSQPFSLQTHPVMQEERTIDNQKFEKQMQEIFKISPKYDKIGEHNYTLNIDKKFHASETYQCVSVKRIATAGGKETLRFWNAEGRSRGMGFVQCPVVYLSMKRLLPIGETQVKNVADSVLTDEETQQFILLHNRILSLLDPVHHVGSVAVKNEKNTLGVETDEYDALTISAGQDNVGKIILALFSFQRLQQKYPNDYKGGLLFIDEIESTLFPAAQKQLLLVLNEFADKLKLQIFFTTHSYSILEAIFEKPRLANVIYLKKHGKNIDVHYPDSITAIRYDLEIKAAPTKAKPSTLLKIYTEDNESRLWVKSMLEDVHGYFDFDKFSFSCNDYVRLLNHGFSEIVNNIVVLDGDVADCKIRKHPNVIKLPGDCSPEKLFYDFLSSLDDDDKLWNNNLGGYSKQVCLHGYSEISDRDLAKQWFNSQFRPERLGKTGKKLFNRWKKENPEMVEMFREKFFAYVKRKTGIDLRTPIQK